ncbi:MAG: YIP1 family protein, partial [Acidobacteriota bacterium]
SFTERGRQAQLEFQVQQMERFGVTVTDEMYTAMEKQSQKQAAYAPFIAIVGTFVIFPIIVLIVSGILYAVFNAIMGGTAEFKQVMAVVSHAWMVPTLGAIFGGIMNFVKGVVSTSVANLGMLLPMLKEGSFIANLAGAVDLFQIWFIITLSIGLGVLYKRKTSGIATGLFVVYAIIAIGFSYFLRKG